MSKLTQQMPVPALRVVYAASGMHVSATLVTDPRMLTEHGVYWCSVATEIEGRYLVGVLNSPVLTDLVRPLMSYGKDERHIDKHVWKLPIPQFDPTDDSHRAIASLAGDLADEISQQSFRSTNFVTIRQDIRSYVASSEIGHELNRLVGELLEIDPELVVTTPASELEATHLIRMTSDPLGLSPVDIELDIDCEFDRAGRVYLWGVLETRVGEQQSTYHAFGSPDPSVTEETVTQALMGWLSSLLEHEAADGRQVRWFHYGRVDAQHLQRIGGPSANPILALATDLLSDVIRPNFYAPGGYGLKTLAAAAGATWRTESPTGADALTWIDAARAGDAEAWQRLLDYNEDDTRATQTLRGRLANADQPGWTLD